MLANFNNRRKMKVESRQIPQRLAAGLKFVCCSLPTVVKWVSWRTPNCC